MNTRAKCINTSCKLYDVEKSVAVGTLTGYGAANDREKCPECGKLMRTTKTQATTGRGTRKRRRGARPPDQIAGAVGSALASF